MTRPVLNLNSPIGEVILQTGAKLPVFLKQPWNSFFQQFVQKAPEVQTVTSASPYTANQNGVVIVQGGTTVQLSRGSVIIALGNGQFVIPVSIGDTVSWTAATAAFFLGS